MKNEPEMLRQAAANVRARFSRKWKRHAIGSAAVACALLVIPYAQAQTTPLAARLNTSPAVPGNSFQSAVAGVAGWNYAVQASTDLVNWVSLETNTSPFTFVDTNSGALPQRFYRAVPIDFSPQGAGIINQSTVLRRNGAIMDLNFGPTPSGAPMTGFAATGLTTNDYWNPYIHPSQTSVTISNLLWSDQSTSSVDMTVLNAPGQWYNSTGDPMYDSFIYPWDGGSVTLIVTNLPAGNYYFYCYGHSQLDQDNTVFQVRSGSYTSATEQTTASHLAATSDVWVESLQYVVFRNVPVTTGQSVTITASPGSGVAILNGIQIIPVASLSRQGPTVTSQPTSLCQTQGGNAAFTVGAVGTGHLRYQWKFNGSNIHGAVTSSLGLVNVQAAEAGSYSVTVTGRYGSVTSAAADLTVLGRNGAIMDLNFGPTPSGGPMTGFAATGLTTNDYWNPYIHPSQTSVTISNLQWSDQSASSVGMTVLNAPGQWYNSTGDPMYDSFIYPWDGGSVTLIVTNLPAGNYYFYCYGHSQLDQDNTVFQVTSGSYTSATEQTTASHLAATSDVWVEGLQYVVFRNVPVTTDQSVTLTASPGSGVAILNGIQIIPLASP